MKFRFLNASLFLALIFVISSVAAFAAELESHRARLLMDSNWRFHLGDDWGLSENLAKAGESDGPAKTNFDDSDWRLLNLPHDWATELPFDKKANSEHGYKPIGSGFPQNSVGWYRRVFTLTDADRGKRLWLEFDGVYRDCRVFLNGFLLEHHESGYNSFRCDITDLASCGGKNVVAVRVDASQFEGWFYEGAGIYRHVWLEKTGPLAIAPNGTFVYSSFKTSAPEGAATLHLESQVVNSKSNSADAKVNWRILGPDEKVIADTTQSATMDSLETKTIGQTAEVSAPILWSPESPKLYKLITTVESGGNIVDRTETTFGIRTLAFDTTNGFILNGKPYVIKGVCLHQDHAGVGLALPDALQYFRVLKLKEAGCNAIRTSHNEPTEELLDACDHLGVLVMDENRRLGSDVQNLSYLKQQICRDRNHASVFIWSLANEEHSYQRTDVGARVFLTMQNLAHQLDPTRLCTAAMDGRADGKADGFSSVMDVQGFNYINRGDMDAFHKSNPAIPCIGTEEVSAYYTRGIYENTKTYQSAYDENKPDYGTTAEAWWTFYSARPWASGSFIWTGFDYRGEESPYHWPNISSEFGIVDACGFPKDVFYYYQSWWADKPVLHLMPHWNWKGRENQEIDVRCFSNCEEVELFLNGQSLGKKKMPKNSHLRWSVKYAPGTLSAKGYADGSVIAEEKIETTGAAAAVQLASDRSTIHADGEDVSVFSVSVVDAQGRVVPMANNLIHFELSGPGKIIGVGNGDPACHEPDIYWSQCAVHSVALDRSWRWKTVSNVRNQQQPEFGVNCDDSSWKVADVRSQDGPLHEHEQAVFRTRFQVTNKDLQSDAVELSLGRIDDDGFIYVNGQYVGDGHVSQMPAVFELKPFLHPGENIIAVGVANDLGPGGLSRGVTLKFRSLPPLLRWQRSVFNGLAQVLVQSVNQPGAIKLTATGEGLSAATKTIEAEPEKPRPSVP
jgi:beta-galactosidase